MRKGLQGVENRGIGTHCKWMLGGGVRRADGQEDQGRQEEGNKVCHRNNGVKLMLEGQECGGNQGKGDNANFRRLPMNVHWSRMLEETGQRYGVKEEDIAEVLELKSEKDTTSSCGRRGEWLQDLGHLRRR